ncbi:lycopene cyclase family protein [Spiribacter onubensis]|uniref:Lycopene cyclase family protein n=1 Tax=Spiribacter onubensis TaxID=3122420 RepID=A0ABV3S7I8_9GAMM
MSDFDLALIGFGAAAMSLAVRLTEGYPGRIAIIEPRALPLDDQTWCGWRIEDHPFVGQVERSWTSWSVSHADEHLVRGSQHIPYEMLRSSAVQRHALEAVGGREDWTCFSGASLVHATLGADGWRLVLGDGRQLSARRVLDSRAAMLRLPRPWVWQSFIGREISGPDLDGSGPVRLMHFLEDDEPLLTFVYELPINAGRRLIELTRFTPDPPARAQLGGALDRLLDERGYGGYTVEREEHGNLPMAPIKPYNRGGWMRIGTAGGSMRPATGYAFHGIQQWADRCAQALIAGNEPFPPGRQRILDWLDGVFLESLWADADIGRAPERFMALFRKTPAESLVRFLMSQPRPGDVWGVLRALPAPPMVAAAARYSLSRSKLAQRAQA